MRSNLIYSETISVYFYFLNVNEIAYVKILKIYWYDTVSITFI